VGKFRGRDFAGMVTWLGKPNSAANEAVEENGNASFSDFKGQPGERGAWMQKTTR